MTAYTQSNTESVQEAVNTASQHAGDISQNRIVLIASRGGNVSRFSYTPTTKSAKAMDYKHCEKGGRIPALRAVVHSMKQILAKPEGISTIYAPGLVADNFARGTFKFWLMDGVTAQGNPLDKEEIDLWVEIANLYTENFAFINIRNISDLKLPKNRKYNVTAEQKTLDALVTKLWDRVPKDTQSGAIEESEAI